MFIISQDRDATFTLTDKGLLRSHIETEDVYYNGTLIGINVIGVSLFRKVILGTYDSDFDAEYTVQEMIRALKHGQEFYNMPEPVLSEEELGVGL